MDDIIALVFFFLIRGFLSIDTDLQFKRTLISESSVRRMTTSANSALSEGKDHSR